MSITRKTTEKNIKSLIKAGPLKFAHRYNQTMTSEGQTAMHTLEVPKHLATLVSKSPTAEVIEMGDGGLGIEIDGQIWALENPMTDKNYKDGYRRGLPHEVWQYLNLALGREIDGVKLGDTYAR